MDPVKLVYLAMLVQVAIPISVLLLNAKRKSDQTKTGEISEEAPIDNRAWSLPVLLTSNSLANQFQLPVLFYVLCLMLIQVGHVNQFVVGLCWWFVVTRWVHAYVHVTSNHIPHRLGAFLAGALSLLILFVYTSFVFITL